MAIRAIGQITFGGAAGTTAVRVSVSYVGFADPPIDSGVEFNIEQVDLLQHVALAKQAVEDDLTNEHGFVFAGGDTVELL